MNENSLTIAVRADTAPVSRALKELEGLAGGFGSALSGALRDAAIHGRALEDVLRGLGASLAGKALDFGLQPLEKLAASMLRGAMGGAGGLSGFARGGVFSGGVVTAPSLFPMRGGTGLMGEAGPEAILPLARGPDGRLGVAAAGQGPPVSVTVNVQASDPAAFERSEALVSEMLARAVSRGLRTL